ncbi:hypothetical protein [Pyrococcus yayanosii]|uniref:Uncharacterized protein n=1 Tax=Pyrococcus yayanosii (strain CH1 / JCM 16557) TaxID=529709 RepID=F8AG48_PYRYC|nr:hypothetical protein [Pyrococcus yayanosii]AEH25106.1 hypothetical protein PYCH_14360 [Pyrococcus yayanosii CH1]
MPRRLKYPPYVVVRIPRDMVEVYETNILDLVFGENGDMARRIVDYIKKNERIYPDEYKEIIKDSSERMRYYRTLRKMISLGMLKRGKDGSYILSDEFALKLGAMIEKWRAILR